MTTNQLHQLFLKHPNVCTDSRKITPNSIFFALRGENFDGNTFVTKALKDGAAFAVIDSKEYHQEDQKTILVKDTLTALQELAAFHRTYLGIPVLALTGSNGKTTTKELIYAVLRQHYTTIATVGNLNNHIGVPLTLLGMNENTQMGIVEMGANHAGEIAFLCSLANPDYGYITNFGKAHLEGFGSLQGVIEAKSELYSHLRKNNKMVFVNANDPIQIAKTSGMDIFCFGDKHIASDLQVEFIDANPNIRLKFSGTEITTNLIGTYNTINIAAAIAIGLYFKVPKEAIKKGIEAYTPTNNRSQILHQNSNTILLDAYNANPSSMLVAIENFKQLKATKKVVFLGDMFELGKDAEQEHQAVVDLVASANFDAVYFIGKNFFKAKVSSPEAIQLESFEDAKAHLENKKLSNTSILIKGSRGMALERLLEVL